MHKMSNSWRRSSRSFARSCLLAFFIIILLLGTLAPIGNDATASNLPLKIASSADGIRSQYIYEEDIPVAINGQKIDTLIDSYNNRQELYFDSPLMNRNKLKHMFEFSLRSQSSRKDQFAAIEVYKNINGTLTPLDYNEYDLNKSTKLDFHLYLSDLKGLDFKYLYFRVGVFNNMESEYYSDETFFKVFIMPSPTGSSVMEGSYVLFTNESTDPSKSMNTGKLNINSDFYTKNKNLRLQAYQMDINKTFKVDNIRKNLYKKNITKSSVQYELGSSKEFWAYNHEKDEDYKLNAKLMYSGSKVNVWVHNDEITEGNAKQLGEEFDNRIYSSVINHFGPASDVDGDGKINLLCFDIQDGFEGNGGFIGGYFNQMDVFDVPGSNKSELLYIDTYPALGKNKNELTHAFSTIAHELQHLVNFNQNVLIEGDIEGMDVWLDEAMSMAAEQIYKGTRLSDRIDYYNESFSIAKGHSLLYWDYNGDTLANYSLSYLFGQYLKTQAKQGDSIFKELLKDPNNNYKAVENVVKKYVDPTLSFGKFSTHFRAALLLKESTGLNGFNGDFVASNLQPRLYAGTMKDLRGGGAVFVKIDPRDGFYEPESISSDMTYTVLSTNGIPASQIPVYKLKVDPIGEIDEVITGIGYANGKVTVKLDPGSSVVLGEVSTGNDGKFSINISKQRVGQMLYIFTQSATGKSKGIYVKVVDKTPPAKPIVEPIYNKDVNLKGKAEAYSHVIVMKEDDILALEQTNSNGNFNVYLGESQPIGTVLTVYVQDEAGNKGPEVTVKVESAPPTIFTVANVNDQSIEVKGKTDSNSIVYVRSGNMVIGKGTSKSNGDFSIKIPKQRAGTELTIYAENTAGKVSVGFSITITAVPAKPTVEKVADNETIVKGKATAGLTIVVKLGTKVLGEGIVNNKGVFSVRITGKQKAGTTLTVYAVNEDDNKSVEVKVKVIDKTPPTVPTVNEVVNSKSTTLSGKAEPGSTVYIYNGSKLLTKVTVGKNGQFTGKIKAQKKGTKLTVLATDLAGNKSGAKMVVVK
jgi:large repetitive protein